MPFIADLHIHSRYSRATSREMSPGALWRLAQLKGIFVIGTGDFTHPEWFRELEEKLEPAEQGLFALKERFRTGEISESCQADVRFILSAEISCVYKKKGKTRKVHCIVLVPSFREAERINRALSNIGNVKSDGRPILGVDAKELLKITLTESPDALFVPAHAWTPHFSVLGAASGFDSLEDCFEEMTTHIHAIETGLSSDPPMNWRLSALDGVTLISNSDAHSPFRIGREANILDTEVSYRSIIGAVKTGEGFLGTIEFFPEEGKYHYDGHRACGVSLSPGETVMHNGLCPVCGKKVTIGVMHRVEKLADRKEGFRPENARQYRSLIPLGEIIAEVMKVGPNSRAVEREYFRLLEGLGSEFSILMDRPVEEIEEASSAMIARAIAKVRSWDVSISPGFDGEYGKVRILEKAGRKKAKGQIALL